MSEPLSRDEALISSSLELLRYSSHVSRGKQELMIGKAIETISPYLTDREREDKLPEFPYEE